MAYAEWQFRLDKPQPEGALPLRAAFRQYQQDTGKRHPEDAWPYGPPKAGLYLLKWFWEISRGRQMPEGQFGRLSALEINAWRALRRVQLLDWEIDAIFRLDSKFIEVMLET